MMVNSSFVSSLGFHFVRGAVFFFSPWSGIIGGAVSYALASRVQRVHTYEEEKWSSTSGKLACFAAECFLMGGALAISSNPSFGAAVAGGLKGLSVFMNRTEVVCFDVQRIKNSSYFKKNMMDERG